MEKHRNLSGNLGVGPVLPWSTRCSREQSGMNVEKGQPVTVAGALLLDVGASVFLLPCRPPLDSNSTEVWINFAGT